MDQVRKDILNATQIVFESIATSYPFERGSFTFDAEKGAGEVSYLFITSNNRKFSVDFWYYYYAELNVGLMQIGFNDDQKDFGITGKGDANKIFGTVIKIIKDLFASKIIKFPITYFGFHAKEPSRAKLYKSLVREFKIPGYEIEINGRKGYFIFVKEHTDKSLKKIVYDVMDKSVDLPPYLRYLFQKEDKDFNKYDYVERLRLSLREEFQRESRKKATRKCVLKYKE
jgi:hypothetical protein